VTTFNEHGNAMMVLIEEKAESASAFDGPARRDLALARTHLEDALTRYNSACYRINGTWKRADPDTPEKL
jgi:hypothetical protein